MPTIVLPRHYGTERQSVKHGHSGQRAVSQAPWPYCDRAHLVTGRGEDVDGIGIRHTTQLVNVGFVACKGCSKAVSQSTHRSQWQASGRNKLTNGTGIWPDGSMVVLKLDASSVVAGMEPAHSGVGL